MRRFRMLCLLALTAACKSTGHADLSATEKAPVGATAIDWSKNSELTSAPIVQKDCTPESCPADPVYELGLHKEFWRHVHRQDFKGMEAWYQKTKTYTDHWAKQGTRNPQIGRLSKLLAFSQGMMLLQYDLHDVVPALNTLLYTKDLGHANAEFKQVAGHPALVHLIQGLGHGIEANRMVKDDLNAQTVLLVIGSFAQATMPPVLMQTQGMTGLRAYVNTLYGPTCKDIQPNMQSLFGNVCYENGLMGPGLEAYKSCVDRESCAKVGTGPEGLIAGAMSLVMLHGTGGAQRMLNMLGDGPGDDQIASCNAYWCSVINPNDPNAPVPEATALTPFKKIGSLLAIAEAYGKVGKLAKMKKVLAAVRAEARRLNYPHTWIIDRVEASLTGGSQKLGVPDLLATWKNPDPKKDILGSVQFPLPVSGQKGNCVSCHYGGVLPKDLKY